MYFGYASYMNSKKIHEFCPSARFVGIACAPGVHMRFRGSSETWKGAKASMVDGGDGIWGVLWSLDTSQLPMLDE